MNRPISCFGACAAAALLAAAPAPAEPFEGCGTVVTSPTCRLLAPDDAPNERYHAVGLGLYFPGDRVFIRGDLLRGCSTACLISTGCILNPGILPCTPPPACRADFDGSGSVGVQDIFAFLAAYFMGGTGPSPPSADFDENGQVTVNDIFAFLAAYFAGCP